MNVQRLNEKLVSDPKRVILQSFRMSESRTNNIVERISSLSESEAEKLLENIKIQFSARHKNFDEKIYNNFNEILGNTGAKFSKTKKYLLGAYFSKEYSIEAAALFNPSMVFHPDQSGLKPGSARIILSLRATGEGHISSIEFRTGILNTGNNLYLDQIDRQTELGQISNGKSFYVSKIKSRIKNLNDAELKLLNKLPEKFSTADFSNAVNELDGHDELRIISLKDYLDSNYKIKFDEKTEMNERVIFPYSKSESMGMEDMRLVKFTNDDGSQKYYGTYTAYNGRSFRVQMLETEDFLNFEIRKLNGDAVKDKGMALFPEKINGKYYMIGRHDGENLTIMQSDDLYYWNNYKLLKQPEHAWEFVQLGNCGSPIETEKGWLLITHAVGPFRKYSISACLLDKNNPEKVIASLKEPLIAPEESEREGYVPNVVYSCGSVIHNDDLVIPYAMSDSATGFAKVNINELLNEMK